MKAYGAGAYPGNDIGGGKNYTNIITSGDYDVKSLTELNNLMRNYNLTNKVVFIPEGYWIDTTPAGYLFALPYNSAHTGVKFTSNRGRNGSLGGGFKFTQGGSWKKAWKVNADDVNFNGVRFWGPDQTTSAPTIEGLYCEGRRGLEVENFEVYGFGHCGITVFDDRGVGGINNPGRAHIHHGDTHHNQNPGVGYGVQTWNCSALIECLRADYNRHHIAGQRGASNWRNADFVEYRYNILGPNGPSNAMHDHHGGNDSGDVAICPDSIDGGDWGNSGCPDVTVPAGGELLIHHNDYMSASRSSVGIRGIPKVKVVVEKNWTLRSGSTEDEIKRAWYQRLNNLIGSYVDGVQIVGNPKVNYSWDYYRMVIGDNWYGPNPPPDITARRMAVSVNIRRG